MAPELRLGEARGRHGVEKVRAACRRLAGATDTLRSRPWSEIADHLGEVGARFSDSTDPLRLEALERLPQDAGLTPAMAEVVLDGMARDWTADRLRRTVEAQFEEPGCLDGLVPGDEQSSMAIGPALCLQIVSGSVPGVGVNALIRSLLVKAPTLLKPGRGDVVLPELYARGLLEQDRRLAEALEVSYWARDDESALQAALDACDVATVYGSDATIEAVRGMTRATTRVVGYHHRIGVAIVGRAVFETGRVLQAAGDLARAVALFEQRGCVCPHLVFVEEGDGSYPERFARGLAAALGDLEVSLPSAPLDAAEGAALQQLRGTAEIVAAADGGWVRHGRGSASWTVVYEPRPREPLPTLARGVRVRPITDGTEVPREIQGLGPHLQTVGHAGLGRRLQTVAESLARLGASRVVPLANMSFPPPWWLHDGRGPLWDLVRWAEVEPE